MARTVAAARTIWSMTRTAPDAVVTPALWLEADGISGGLNDGDPVSTWNDLSGNGRDFTQTGTNRPTYKTNILNGLPAVLFDGTNDYIKNTSYFPTNNFTVITLVSTLSVNSNRTIWIRGRTGGSGRVETQLSNASPRVSRFNGSATLAEIPAVTSVAVNQWWMLGFQLNGNPAGTASAVTLNGIGPVVTAQLAQNVDAGGGSQIHYFGTTDSAAASFWNGYMVFMGLWQNNNLGPNFMNTTMAYLANKYGLLGSSGTIANSYILGARSYCTTTRTVTT